MNSSSRPSVCSQECQDFRSSSSPGEKKTVALILVIFWPPVNIPPGGVYVCVDVRQTFGKITWWQKKTTHVQIKFRVKHWQSDRWAVTCLYTARRCKCGCSGYKLVFGSTLQPPRNKSTLSKIANCLKDNQPSSLLDHINYRAYAHKEK